MVKKLAWVVVLASMMGVMSLSLAQSSSPLFGTISNNTPFVEYPITLREGDTLSVTLERESGDLDPLLHLVDSNSVIVASNDDISPSNNNAHITFTRAPAGSYTMVATRFDVLNGKTSGRFKLSYSVRRESNTRTLLNYDTSEETLTRLGYPANHPIAPEAEWTILAYFGGDTNLEPGVMNDFNEFELAGGSSETVRIVALLDRHPEFARGSGDWQTARLFEVQADVSNDHTVNFPPTIDSEPLADLGKRDTSDGATLAEFLVWGLRHYPAKRYAILIGSHGGAWQGIVTDDTEGEAILGLAELYTAFELARQEAGVERFDLLINDACSMSSVEYHSTLAEMFRMSLASPEIVVDPALDLTYLAKALQETPDIDITIVGVGIIDGYMNAVRARSSQLDREYLSYALTDLTQHNALTEAVEAFAKHVNRDPLRYASLLGAARSNAYTYSAFLGLSEQIDVGDFMRQIVERTTDSTLRGLAQNVIEAAKAPLTYGLSAPRIQERISFYNVYFPADADKFDPEYLRFAPMPSWGKMLRDYFTATSPRLWRVEDSPLAFHPPVAPKVNIARVYPYTASIVSPPTVNVEIVGRRIASGAFTIDRLLDDGTVVRLAETDILTAVKDDNTVRFVNEWRWGVDRSVFQWTPFTLPVVTDGANTANEFVRRQGELYALDGRYREPNAELWNEVSVLFADSGEVVSVISSNRRGGALASIVIAPNSEFQTYRFVVASNGSVKRQLGNVYTWGESGIRWHSAPTPNGNYNIGFVVQAFGGAIGFDSARVRVDNTNAPDKTRGYTDVNLGITFQMPDDWSPVVDFGNWLNTTSADKTLALNVYSFDAPANVYDIARDTQARYGLWRTSELLTLDLFGSPAVYFDHTYSNTDGTSWRGRAIAFYRNTVNGGRGVVFSVDTRQDSTVQPPDLFRSFLNGLSIIGAGALVADDMSAWEYRLYGGFIPYPRLKNWDTYLEREWVYQNPRNGYKGLTFSRLREIKGRSAPEVLGFMLRQYAYQAQGFALRTYVSQTHTWYTASYTRTQRARSSLGRIYTAELTGRIYVTRIYDTYYAWHFEVPTESATATLRSIFEPMVDGFAPTVDFASGGAQTAFIKAATLAQSTFCPDMTWDTLCFGGGNALHVSTDAQELTIRRAGERSGLQSVRELSVGIDDDGSVNPYAVAILHLQANLPNRNSGEYLRVIAFGGATLTNNATFEDGQFANVQVINRSEFRVNLRQSPDESAPVVGALAMNEVADAVAVFSNDVGEWVRVRVPRDEASTGWILRRFVRTTRPNESLEALKTGDPTQPDYGAYQSFGVRFAEGESILPGIFVQTSLTKETLYLNINGTIYEVGGGLNFLWLEGEERLQNVSSVTDSDIFNVENNNRVPETSLVQASQTSPARIPVTATYTPSDVP
jgi:hypothetical protein